MNPVSAFLTIVIALFTAAITWLLGRTKAKGELRKLAAETDSIQIKNVASVVNFWKEQAEEIKAEYEITRTEYKKLYLKLDEVLRENESLRKELHQLKKEMGNLKKQLQDQQTN